ncbi:MAG: SCP2 sterol-binding domain-containing protein [Actinomycetota bacterium]
MKLFAITRRLTASGLRSYVRVVGGLFGVPAGALQMVGQVTQWLDPVSTNGSHPFLSAEWLDAARQIRESYRGRTSVAPPPLRVNLVVLEMGVRDEIGLAHIDTTSGDVEFELGHLAEPDVTVTTSYEVAKTLIVDADANAAMQALMKGDVQVDGDVSKLLLLGAVPVDPLALEATEKIRAITS